QAKLCISLLRSRSIHVVIAGVGQVVSVAKPLKPRVFDATAFFIRRLGAHDGLGASREMNAIFASGIAERGSTLLILRSVEQHKFPIFVYDRGIEGTSRLESIALWSQNWISRKPLPFSEGKRSSNRSHCCEGKQR